jgi:hypothetical protein
LEGFPNDSRRKFRIGARLIDTQLGIHHAPESVSGVTNLSVEEQATRDRLFWAAFIWDK